jgi:hypothetical protein
MYSALYIRNALAAESGEALAALATWFARAERPAWASRAAYWRARPACGPEVWIARWRTCCC